MLKRWRVVFVVFVLFVSLSVSCSAQDENWTYLCKDEYYDIYFDANNTKGSRMYIAAYDMDYNYINTYIKRFCFTTGEWEKFKMRFELGTMQNIIVGAYCEIKGKWRMNGDKKWIKEKYTKGLYKVAKDSQEWLIGTTIYEDYCVEKGQSNM